MASSTGGIRFCQWCNNMLYPKVSAEEEDVFEEDGTSSVVKIRKLKYSCRYDDYEEDADSPCVYQNTVQHAVDEVALIISDVVLDPTLPRTDRTCPKCGCQEAVYFQAQINRESQGMQLYFVCTSCRYRWTSNDTDEPKDDEELDMDNGGEVDDDEDLLDSGDAVLDVGVGLTNTMGEGGVSGDDDDMGLGDDLDDDDDDDDDDDI